MQAVKDESEIRQTEMQIFLEGQDVVTRNHVEKMVEDVYLENLIMQYDLNGFEIKLLQYISEGKANKKIANKLKIKENDVVDYTKDLYKKLQISEHIEDDYNLLENQPDFIYN
jgi:DNA-binding NarL/FixJ family response regulator